MTPPPPPLSAQAEIVRAGDWTHYTLRFGRLSIEWTLPSGCEPDPIGINYRGLGKERDLKALCDITFRWGRHAETVSRGYLFDGASIPRWFRWLPGYERIGQHLWAALLHDWICDRPDVWPRVIGDAIFVTLLLVTGVPGRQSRTMYVAVRVWSVHRAYQLGFVGPLLIEAVEDAKGTSG